MQNNEIMRSQGSGLVSATIPSQPLIRWGVGRGRQYLTNCQNANIQLFQNIIRLMGFLQHISKFGKILSAENNHNILNHQNPVFFFCFFSFLSRQDFTIQQLERKIARLQGERSTEELDALNAKIKELTEMLDERNDTHQLLATQLKRLQVRTRGLT